MWLNLNDSLNNIKGQLSNFATNVLADELFDVKNETESSTGATGNLDKNVKVEEFQDGQKAAFTWPDEDWSKTDQLKTDETITHLKGRISELETDNRNLTTSLDQLDQNHQHTMREIMKIRDKLREDLDIAASKYDIINMKCNQLELEKNALKKKLKEGENAVAKFNESRDEVVKLTEKLLHLENTNAELVATLADCKSKLVELEAENKAFKITIKSQRGNEDNLQIKTAIDTDFEETLKTFEHQLSTLSLTNEKLKADQEKLQEFVKGLSDIKLATENEQFNEESENFIRRVLENNTESIVLQQCSELVKSLLEEIRTAKLSETETRKELTEKIANLKKDYIKKSQETDELSEECAALMKNNDILVTKLEETKNTEGLQTIYEANEENLNTLEKQLEDSNGKIASLQETICTFETENRSLLDYVRNLKSTLLETEKERDDFKMIVEKTRNDLEMSEYRCEEMNIGMKTMTDDIEACQSEIQSLKATLRNQMQTTAEMETGHLEMSKLKEENERWKELRLKILDELDLDERTDEAIILKKISVTEKMKNEMATMTNDIEGYQSEIQALEDVLKKQTQRLQETTAEMEMGRLEMSKLKEENEMWRQFRLKILEELQLDETADEAIILEKISATGVATGSFEETTKRLAEQEELIKTLQSAVVEKDANLEKTADRLQFLEEKCETLSRNLIEDQKTIAEKNRKLERLQNHLVETEERHTQELMQADEKYAILVSKVADAERREKESSTLCTSLNIRANQQNESLKEQLRAVTNQWEDCRRKVLELEDENNVKAAALNNLQLVLEQFQRDKEQDVIRETDRIRRQMNKEREMRESLMKDVNNLEGQLRDNKEGMQAALRLRSQLETCKNQTSSLKEEVAALKDKLLEKEEELKACAESTDAKVDKSLIKNLIIGFVASTNTSPNKDQLQVLKIIATVLDFNEQDHAKVKIGQYQQESTASWLKSLLAAPPTNDSSVGGESLSKAFVNFLENESRPRPVPSLLSSKDDPPQSAEDAAGNKTNPEPPRQPLLLNEVVLPTFMDFSQHCNSSSILKGVLKDNP